MTEEITMTEVYPEARHEEVKPEKVYDLDRIKADYEQLQTQDAAQMTRITYAKYLWLEQKLLDAGIVGEQAWEQEYEGKANNGN